jgi:hypothetical protein
MDLADRIPSPQGGHFIALEQPVTLWKDVAAFADQVVPAKSKL